MNNLGKFQRVPLRNIWAHEAQEFTPWLAENIDLLSQAHPKSLTVESRERYIGSFRADIIASDKNMDQLVLIENQLGGTSRWCHI